MCDAAFGPLRRLAAIDIRKIKQPDLKLLNPYSLLVRSGSYCNKYRFKIHEWGKFQRTPVLLVEPNMSLDKWLVESTCFS